MSGKLFKMIEVDAINNRPRSILNEHMRGVAGSALGMVKSSTNQSQMSGRRSLIGSGLAYGKSLERPSPNAKQSLLAAINGYQTMFNHHEENDKIIEKVESKLSDGSSLDRRFKTSQNSPNSKGAFMTQTPVPEGTA